MGVLEIERAIEALPEEELAELTQWFTQRGADADTTTADKPQMARTVIDLAQAGAAAQRLFRERIAGRIAESDRQKLLLIDIDSGDYEIGINDMQMENRLLTRQPNAEMVLMRADGGPVTSL